MGLFLTRRLLHCAVWLGAAFMAGCGGGGVTAPPAADVAPTIATQPAAASVTAGQPATFSVSASGTAPLAYQWRRAGVDIAGAQASSYSTAATAIGDNGVLFSVVVSNAAGSVTSANAALTVSVPAVAPSIATQPASVTVAAGATATFTVAAAGGAPLNYQWRRNGANIAGAAAQTYVSPPTAASDDGARFSVVVSNGAGNVTSSEAVLTVTASAPAPAARYVPAWSSSDTTSSNGRYTLSVVDPLAPATLIAVDQVPAGDILTNSFLNVLGGDFDAGSGLVRDAGVRNLVYLKAGAIYRVNLDKGGAAPTPVRLSTEAQARNLSAAAVSASGDEALITYFIPGSSIRYVDLLATGSSAPRAAPVFPGDVPSSTRLLGSATDPATGAIRAHYWESAPLGFFGRRLFRTDAAFGNATNIATFASTSLDLLWEPGLERGMRGGLFFLAERALQRLDFATGAVRVVQGGVNFRVGQAANDDSHVYLMFENTAGLRQLVRAADDVGSPGQVIASGAALTGYATINTQTRDHLIFITGFNGGTAVSMRKIDGLSTPLPPPPGSTPALPHSWNTAASLDDGTSGNRVFYQLALGGFGSVDADGTDRKEHSGNLKVKRMLPSALAPHRLHTSLGSAPAARILTQNGTTLRWLELASGDLGVIVGTEPNGATYGNDAFSPVSPYGRSPLGRAGTIGYLQVASASTVGRLDAIYLTDQAGSLLRLTQNIP